MTTRGLVQLENTQVSAKKIPNKHKEKLIRESFKKFLSCSARPVMIACTLKRLLKFGKILSVIFLEINSAI